LRITIPTRRERKMILVLAVMKLDDIIHYADGRLVVEVPHDGIVGIIRTYEDLEKGSKQERYLMVDEKGGIRVRADYA